jgi:competence protein ComEA
MKGVLIMKNLKQVLFALILTMASFAAWAVPVDINHADADTLAAELTGVGAAKAEAIVAYREANGPFRSIEDLARVKGIGAKTVEKNRANLVIETQSTDSM